ncbi:MAG: sulfite exporter TauE/SafE family protein [Acetobacteraceae bacterium]|nr:sulfite exporter TauE/SafE family protein [Acetobacteraceae bacterium]
MTLAQAWWPSLVLLLAGLVKGVIGLGLPAIGVGLIGLVMPPVQAAAILVVPSSVTNVWQLAAGPNFRGVFRRLWPLLICILLGTYLGGGTLSGGNTAQIRLWLGIVLASYGVFGLLARRYRVQPRWENWLGPLVGLATGVVTTATGLFMLPLVPYLAGLDGLDREDLVQALGLSFTVSTLGLTVDLLRSHALTQELLIASCIAVLPALIGMQIGTVVRSRISPLWFRRCFYGGMVGLGIELVRHF